MKIALPLFENQRASSVRIHGRTYIKTTDLTETPATTKEEMFALRAEPYGSESNGFVVLINKMRHPKDKDGEKEAFFFDTIQEAISHINQPKGVDFFFQPK